MSIIGIDVSTWNDIFSTPQHCDFAISYAAGARYVFVKASQATSPDDDFRWNWHPAKDAGLLRGAYHFYDWSVPPEIQADYFWNVCKLDPGELPPVGDFEMLPPAGMTQTATINAAKRFMLRVEHNWGCIPLMYTSQGYWGQWGSLDTWWQRFPLWVANYTTASIPAMPAPWTKWLFWQYTSQGNPKLYGTEGDTIDLNRYNGTLDDLHNLVQVIQPVPTPKEVIMYPGKRMIVKGASMGYVPTFNAPAGQGTTQIGLPNGAIVTVPDSNMLPANSPLFKDGSWRILWLGEVAEGYNPPYPERPVTDADKIDHAHWLQWQEKNLYLESNQLWVREKYLYNDPVLIPPGLWMTTQSNMKVRSSPKFYADDRNYRKFDIPKGSRVRVCDVVGEGGNTWALIDAGRPGITCYIALYWSGTQFLKAA